MNIYIYISLYIYIFLSLDQRGETTSPQTNTNNTQSMWAPGYVNVEGHGAGAKREELENCYVSETETTSQDIFETFVIYLENFKMS